MRANTTANFRPLIAALTVITFVAISTYLYVGSISPSSTLVPNQNSATFTEQATIQNTTTYSYATMTSESTTSFIPPSLTIQPSQEAPPPQTFGNLYFEPPSAILIPADTLTWTNFQLNDTILNGTSNFVLGGLIYLFPYPEAAGVNVTVGVYLNGFLKGNATTHLFNQNYGIESSLIPTSTSPNSIFALKGTTPLVTMGTQTESTISLSSSTTITFAFSSDKPIWLAGWTQADIAAGTGAKYGQSAGQLAGTFETPESGTSLPNALPKPTTTLTFQLQISGDLQP